MNKRTFTGVVGENFSIARDKFYISDSGVKVELGNLIEEMIKNTEIITQDELMYEKYIRKLMPKEIKVVLQLSDNKIN